MACLLKNSCKGPRFELLKHITVNCGSNEFIFVEQINHFVFKTLLKTNLRKPLHLRYFINFRHKNVHYFKQFFWNCYNLICNCTKLWKMCIKLFNWIYYAAASVKKLHTLNIFPVNPFCMIWSKKNNLTVFFNLNETHSAITLKCWLN